MQPNSSLVLWSNSGTTRYLPRRLRSLGKDEEFLEEVLATHPELLGLENRRTGIYGPFVYFRQVSLKTPAGREIYPDIVFLSKSGHFIVVEVKLGDNSELKDRDVIAQIIDYASSFAALSDQELVDVLDKSFALTGSWFEFIKEKFPEESDPEELAGEMRRRIASGEINLVIACDRIPPGLPEIVKGIAVQQSTSFALDLTEVTPFCKDDLPDEIAFVPSSRLSTEIVARTTVTVAYQGPAPDITVETTPIEEIEENTRKATVSPTARVWPAEEVEEVVREANNPIEVALLDFCKQHSVGGDFVSPAVKSNATFGFYVVGRKPDGKKVKNMLFYLTHGWGASYINLNTVRQLVDEPISQEFVRRLSMCFGHEVDFTTPQPGIKLQLLCAKMSEFQEVVLWIQDQIGRRL